MNTQIVTLKHGLIIGKSTYKVLKLREPLLDDYCAAEDEANPQLSPIKYRRALSAVCLEKADDFEGPFTGAMLGKLKQADWLAISKTLSELESEGEAEQPGE